MKEYYGNILDLIGKADAICVTTNLFVKADGSAVMGRGIAKAIQNIIPDAPQRLGRLIREKKYVDIISIVDDTRIVAFPVKPANLRIESEDELKLIVTHMRDKFKVGDTVPGWACVAFNSIISASCLRLMNLADECRWQEIYLPRPGCGAGERSYKDIKPLLEGLDDRFYVSTFKRR